MRTALAQRVQHHRSYWKTYWEMHADTELHGLWLCGRCGENTETTPCEAHDRRLMRVGYYVYWTLAEGVAIGHCGPCEGAGIRTVVESTVCPWHGRHYAHEWDC